MSDDEKQKILVTDEALALRTDASTPNSIEVEYLAPVKMIVIRVLRTYIQSLVIFLGATIAGVGSNITGVPPGDLLEALKVAAGFSLAPALGSALHNLLDVLASWDTTKPEWRG